MEILKVQVEGTASGSKLLQLLAGQKENCNLLAQAISAVISETSSGPGSQKPVPQDPQGRVQVDSAPSSIKALMFLHPRGKQDVGWFKDHLLVQTAKQDVNLPYTAISNVAVLDKLPKDTKNRVLLYLHLDRNAHVTNGKQKLSAVVIQVLSEAHLDIANPKGAGRLTGPAAVVICQALGAMGVAPSAFCSPAPDVFQGASRESGAEAFVKANQGTLFPMENAICFLERPPMFIPLADIKAVELARAGGTSSTFDFFLHLHDGASHEFSNLSRQQLPSLSSYIAQRGLRQGTGDDEEDAAEAAAASAGVRPAGAAPEEDYVSEEDSDFDPDEDEEEARDRPVKLRRVGEPGARPLAASDSDSAESGDSSQDGDDSSQEQLGAEISDDELQALSHEPAVGKRRRP